MSIGRFRGEGSAARRWRPAAAATTVSGSSSTPMLAARPAITAVRWRKSRRVWKASASRASKRSASCGSRTSTAGILGARRRSGGGCVTEI